MGDLTFKICILNLLTSRGAGKTICPSELLPAKKKHDRKLMDQIRQEARLLAAEGKIEITQRGKPVDPFDFKGPIRLRLKPQMRLFAVYLGGKAEGANIEVHDVVFVCGKTIKDCLPELRSVWFGVPSSLHIDSWIELAFVDGYEISVGASRAKPIERKLFFVNIGSYRKESFGESHHLFFLIAKNATDAKRRAKQVVLQKNETLIHSDNLLAIDSVTPINKVGNLNVRVKRTAVESKASSVTNTYWPIARRV